MSVCNACDAKGDRVVRFGENVRKLRKDEVEEERKESWTMRRIVFAFDKGAPKD